MNAIVLPSGEILGWYRRTHHSVDRRDVFRPGVDLEEAGVVKRAGG
jgi:hypothetical protein